MARIHYLQHVPFEGLGSMEPWLLSRGHSLTSTRFFENAHLPAPKDLDALIIMGGPMGIYDELEFPWLSIEKDFMRACLQGGKKVLGICLGAQLLADCLGARVHPAPHKEIGWFPIRPVADTWVSRLFETNPTVFHWHADQFDIPSGATDILYTDANRCQAFHIGDDVIGLQFHLEVTPPLLEDMIHHGAEELTESPYIQSPAALAAGKEHMTESHRILNNLLQRWLYS